MDTVDTIKNNDSNGKEINGYKELDGQFRLDQAQRMQKYYAEEEKETLNKRTKEKSDLEKEIAASQTKINHLTNLLNNFEEYNTDTLETDNVTHKETWTEGEHIEFNTLANVKDTIIKAAYQYLKDNGLIDVLDKYAGYDSSNNKINGYKETDGQFRKDQLQRMIDDEKANLEKLNEKLKKYGDIK
jgi:DNA-binding transcriptional regulator YhcF (GntR family)